MATIEENILHSLTKNGFPEKKVSLPFQPIFQACKKANTTLTDVLKKLEEKEILNSMEGDRILFFTEETAKPKKESNPWDGIDFSNSMVKEAMEKISEMDPRELEKLKQQVENLSPEEKAEMMNRAKEMFKKTKE